MQYPETKEQMLVEVVKWFAPDPANRRNKRGVLHGCYYAALDDKKKGCAIGMFLDRELAIDLDGDYNMSSVGVQDAWNDLPEQLQLLGESYLTEIQDFHDANRYWSSSGLSDIGKSEVLSIIKSFKLDESKLTEIQKYIS